jgi:hypothetical protein
MMNQPAEVDSLVPVLSNPAATFTALLVWLQNS